MSRLSNPASAILLLLANVCGAQSQTIDPVRAIVAAFDHVNLVGLGERHGSVNDLHFRLRVIRDPAFSRTVNDIVMEFANPLYQDVLDRYVDGEDVPYGELSKVWLTTTQTAVAKLPVYEQFIEGVRAVNANLPRGRRLRIVAGDYPFNPDDPASVNGVHAGYRDSAPADVIRREVLDKHHKALVVFGGLHLRRNRTEFLARMQPNGNMVTLLKDDPRAKWFIVEPIGGPDLPWPVTTIRGTPENPAWVSTQAALNMDAAALGWADRPRQYEVRRLVDALLYFGKTSPVTVPIKQ